MLLFGSKSKAKPFTESIFWPSNVYLCVFARACSSAFQISIVVVKTGNWTEYLSFSSSFRVLDDRKPSHSWISCPIANVYWCTKSTQVRDFNRNILFIYFIETNSMNSISLLYWWIKKCLFVYSSIEMFFQLLTQLIYFNIEKLPFFPFSDYESFIH